MTKLLFVSLVAVLACHDSNGGATTASSASSATSASAAPAECPPAKKTTDMCAAVMTYVKDPASGRCCGYPSPCTVPIAGQQFSDAACASPTK